MTRTPLGPLVGREREFAYLGQCWALANAGELNTPGVTFQGDAGIGKSRLAWSAVDAAERSHGIILQLIGSPFHTDVGLRPVRRLLERRCGIGRTSDPTERLQHLQAEIEEQSLDPASMVPLLAPLLGIDPQFGYQPVHAEGRKLYDRICDAVREYLLACVRETPALVLVEDMHWFDEDTADVVRSLLDAELHGHVLVVITSREQMLPESSQTVAFHLNPLTDNEADELIARPAPRRDRRSTTRGAASV